jgi:beta-phosphoglucomutase-like phosphatase (HAD superfamily)
VFFVIIKIMDQYLIANSVVNSIIWNDNLLNNSLSRFSVHQRTGRGMRPRSRLRTAEIDKFNRCSLSDTVVFIDFGGTIVNTHELTNIPSIFLRTINFRSQFEYRRLVKDLSIFTFANNNNLTLNDKADSVITDQRINIDNSKELTKLDEFNNAVKSLITLIKKSIRSTNPFTVLSRLSQFFDIKLNDSELRAIVAENDSHMLKIIESGRCATFEGAFEAIEGIFQLGATPVIISNCPRSRVEKVVGTTKLKKLITGILTAEDMPLRKGKPDSTIYLTAKEKFLKKNTKFHCAIEDSHAGLAAALGADCPVILFVPDEGMFDDKIPEINRPYFLPYTDKDLSLVSVHCFSHFKELVPMLKVLPR